MLVEWFKGDRRQQFVCLDASYSGPFIPSLFLMAHTIWSSLTRHPRWTALAVIALLAVFPVLPVALAWPARALLLVLCLALGACVLAMLRTAARTPKTAVFGLVALLLSLGFAYGLVELVSWVYLQKVPVSGDPFVLTERQKKFVRFVVNESAGYQVYSPSLGWTIGKSQVSKDGLYRSNADGFRANREYAKEKTPGRIRVLCFGDSYTHCDEVGNQETWEHHAEQAAPGHGVPQLRGSRLQPDAGLCALQGGRAQLSPRTM